MRDFKHKLLFTTALVSSICFAPVKANDTPASAPIPGPSATLPPQSNDDDDDKPQFLAPESDAAIKQANELHAKAVDALKANKIEEAIAFDEQATKVAPHYWLPHAALAYLYSNSRGNGPALEQATWAVKCEHPGLADNTHAALVTYLRAFFSAEGEFKKLLAADPTNWRAKIGLAQCYITGDKKKDAVVILDEMNTPDLKDPAALLLVGYSYKRIGENEKAKDLMKRALAANPDAILSEKILINLFDLAVALNDRPLIAELKGKVAGKLDARQRAWLRIGNIALTETPKDARLALQLAETETVGDREFRDYADIFNKRAEANPTERTEWLTLSKDALTHAFDDKQTIENKILLASVIEQLGDKAAAVKLLKTPSIYTENERTQDIYLAGYYKKMRKTEDLAVGTLFIADGAGYKSTAQAVTFQIPAANCKCKMNSARSIIKGIPGVYDVIVGAGEKPISTILFDPKKTSRDAIFANAKLKHFKEKFEIFDVKPVGTISDVAQMYDKQEHNPIAVGPNVTNVAVQFPTVEDAAIKVSAESKTGL